MYKRRYGRLPMRSRKRARVPQTALQRANAYRRRLPGLMRPSSSNYLKCVDYDLATPFSPIPFLTNSNTSLLCVNAVQQGTSFYNRVGRKITLRSVFINCTITASAAGIDEEKESTTSAVTVRMVVLYDRQPNGAKPNFSEIFASYDNKGVKSSMFLSPMDPSQTSRFRLLRDKVYTLNPMRDSGAVAAAFHDKKVKEYVKIPNLETMFSNTSDPPTIADISTGALYVGFITDLQFITTHKTEVGVNLGSVRTRYDDI